MEIIICPIEKWQIELLKAALKTSNMAFKKYFPSWTILFMNEFKVPIEKNAEKPAVF
ncbi:MAG: hypothetical protein HQM10_23825 [Candidatus Riflebacteria bacterium]|nr:hypothetical protein [Candidatus Riflebacteria bacterium]